MKTDSLNVEKWIQFAQADYDHVIATIETRYPVPIEIMCYHCQQSVEKILKALIVAQESTIIRTHDLEDLLERCARYSSDFNKFKAACSKITTYTATSRYPSDLELTEQDMKQSIKDTQKILEFTKSKLKDMGYEYKPEQRNTV